MSDNYARCERECKIIRGENAKLVDEFEAWLASKGLSDPTVRRHVENVDFYINEFLLYDNVVKPRDRAYAIGRFLGYWFIRKAMWASKASINRNATSLKRFYPFMLEKGEIEREDFDALRNRVRKEMPEWLATLSRYDNPDIDDPAKIWGL